MKRLRWYYSIVVLIIVDAVVIMASLYAYNRTISSATTLIESNQALVEQSRVLHLLQQRVLDLSAPVIDSAETADAGLERRKYEAARASIEATLQSAGMLPVQARALPGLVREISESADEILGLREQMSRAGASAGGEPAVRLDAATARMNRGFREAVRTLDLSIARNASDRNELLAFHEQELRARAAYERYFIAGILIIMAGVLWFAWRLRTAQRALEEARRERLAAIGELASSVAHGIRNPLAAIQGSARLALKRGEKDDVLVQRVRDILHESQRLGDRVTGLLGLVRSSSVERTELELREIVERTAHELDMRFATAQLTLQCDTSSEPVFIDGVSNQVEQIVIELLSNAIDHSKPGDTIRVSCRRNADGRRAILSVEDQGPGVPEEIRPRIFDLFFTTRPDGTGIGLATIKRFAKLHGGDVALENVDGGGARFVVDFPLTDGRRWRAAERKSMQLEQDRNSAAADRGTALDRPQVELAGTDLTSGLGSA